MPDGSDGRLLADARAIIDAARANAVRSVDFTRVMMYWNLDRRIFEEEQQGKDRADYGTHLVRNLTASLEPEYGSGFSYRQRAFSRQFYRTYPIVNALRSQLNWTQYRLLIQIDNPQKREYYELESANHCRTARETERQIHSRPWERLLLSTSSSSTACSGASWPSPEDNGTILAAEYRLRLPSEAQLLEEVRRGDEAMNAPEAK